MLAKAITALSRIMPSNSAISSSKRRLLASVAISVLRYGGPAWASVQITKRNQARLNRTHRLISMRVASAYRTISLEAVRIIAGLIPIGIVLEEDAECYRRRGTSNIRKIVRADSLRKWQQEWDTTANGRWTHRLIPNVSTWIERKHGEINFHLTQFLSGHGCYKKYLHRFGHARSPFCPECSDIEETPEHVMFECPRFRLERSEMIAVSGEDVSADNVIDRMCKNEDTWNAVNSAVVRIQSALQRKWREEQRLEEQ